MTTNRAKHINKEEQFVVDPLMRWFESQQAPWEVQKPTYNTSATGWDIEARRKNCDLLIEAKYITGPFLASFAGLVTAPLANRPQHFVKSKYRGWSYGVCWAIGAGKPLKGVYQILFDYLARNPILWKHYAQDLRMKYVFFVKNGKVTRIPFTTLLRLAERYAEEVANRSLREGQKLERRLIAERLMSRYE